MKKHAAALLFLLAPLALTACGGGTSTPAPAPSADVADDTDDGALVLASTTFKMTAAQAAQSLGLRQLAAAPPTSPVSVTVAVKLGAAGTKYAGQKRAFLGWKFAGKYFPAELTGTTQGSYSLALRNPDGSDLKTKAGTLTVTLPLASGSMTTSRSRSTSYATATGGTCAVASSSLTLANGSPAEFGTASAPLVVCESGTTYNPATGTTPTPAPTLANTYAYSFWGTADGALNHFVKLNNVPVGATITQKRWTVSQAEECGAGDAYAQFGTGDYQQTTSTPDAAFPTFRVPLPVDEQTLTQDHAGVSWYFVVTLGDQSKSFGGVSCYDPTPQAM